MGARPLPSRALSPDGRHPLLEKLHDRREHHRTRSKVVRALYAAVGLTLLLGGIAMLVLPGPAFVVIPIGLFLLALEFAWAERALETSLTKAENAKRRAEEATRTQKILSAVATAAAVAGAVAWAILGDIPLLPV